MGAVGKVRLAGVMQTAEPRIRVVLVSPGDVAKERTSSWTGVRGSCDWRVLEAIRDADARRTAWGALARRRL